MDFCIGTTAKIDAVALVKQASHFGVGEGFLLFSDPYGAAIADELRPLRS